MKGAMCQWVQRGEEVILFDNSLRIESEARIFRAGKWQQRYVVCQRRSLAEAPLVGIFKNDLSREDGDVLDLFYLPNYVGYEWGFKLKGTNKTLAVIVQDETLVFSFQQIESMLFWKEWLKDVCGRSAIFFVKVQNAPEELTTHMSSPYVRLHVNRQALVMMQEVPPQQRLYVNLDEIFDVHCSAGQFAFYIYSPSQTQPSAFLLVGERLYDLSVRLRLLLKPNQFADYARRIDILPNGVDDEAGRARSVSTVVPPPSSSVLPPSAVMGGGVEELNDEDQYENFGSTPKRSLPSNINLAVSLPVAVSSHPPAAERASVVAAGESSEPEGAYAVPELEEIPHEVLSRLQSVENSITAPTLFMNPSSMITQQRRATLQQENSVGGVPPFGLVKPNWPVVMSPGVGGDRGGGLGPSSDSSPFGKLLSRRLRKSVSGSYSRYDGDRVAHDDGREDDEEGAKGSGGDGFSSQQQRPPPPPPVPPPHASVAKQHSTGVEANQAKSRSGGGGWKSRITATLSVPLQKSGRLKKTTTTAESPELTPSRLKPKGSLSASAHSHLNSRIDSAIAKGRERLKQSNGKSSNFSSSNTTRTASSSECSFTDRVDAPASPAKGRRRPPAPPPPLQPAPLLLQQPSIELIVGDVDNLLVGKQYHPAPSNPSHTSSISTLAVPMTNTGEGGESEDEGSTQAVSVYDPATPPVGSRMTLETASQGGGLEKAWNLPNAAGDRADELSLASSVSIRSELDARVQFRRGGRARASGNSSHSKASSKRRGSVSPTPPSQRRLSPSQQIQSQPALTTLDPASLGAVPVKRLGEGPTPEHFLPADAEYAEIGGEDFWGNVASASALSLNPSGSGRTKPSPSNEIPQVSMEHKKSTQSGGSFRFPMAEVDYVSICPNTPPTPRQQLRPNEKPPTSP